MDMNRCKWIGRAGRYEGVKQLEFQEFYESSRDGCLRAILAAAGDRDLAEDLVAESFARAWANWPKVRRHSAPAAWVVRTALNTRVSWWRRRRREVGYDGVTEYADTASNHYGLDPELLTVLRGLPQRQREVVAFRVFLDLDTKATAAVLGIAPGTVTAHLSRALTALRDHFDPVEARP
jgi:RNA polymerase sigma factor (sigma-70 family)